MEGVLYFILGLTSGAGITFLSFKYGAHTYEKAIIRITEPPEVTSDKEVNPDESIPYNWEEAEDNMNLSFDDPYSFGVLKGDEDEPKN
tara:strand:+ start:151 stop:414 length:264 start_codon:yes stop_codon:yes gene_type:complete